MSKRGDKQMIVGLDIGTTKIVAIVGEMGPGGELEIVGIGSHPSRGLKKGVVINLESTVHSIKRAVEEAELMAGCQVHSVLAGIAGSHIRGMNSHGIVAIKEREVSDADVERVLDAAKAVAIPADQRVLHHLVTGATSAAQNIVKAVKQCGLEVDDLILEQLASSYAVLTDDERELGVCLVDIGGGTTDIAVFTEGAIRFTANIPIAGDQVTNDIAVALRTPTQHAEKIKTDYACALSQLTHSEEIIEVPGVGKREARQLSRHTLAEVVEPRYEELLTLVQAELRRSGFEELCAAGIVLTGGSSSMEGVVELAEDIFQTQVRVGVPQDIVGLVDVVRNPAHSTGVGLLRYGAKAMTDPAFMSRGLDEKEAGGVMKRMAEWFKGNF